MAKLHEEYVQFKCAARSKNRIPRGDPFGLRGCIMISEQGVTFEVAKQNDMAPKIGEVVSVQKESVEYRWHKLGFVNVKQLPHAGSEITKTVWGKEPLIIQI